MMPNILFCKIDMGNIGSILFVGFITPMTAVIFWKKANTPATVFSIVIGVLSWLLLEFVQSTYPADLVAAVPGLVTLVVVAYATEKKIPALPLTDIEGNHVDYKDRFWLLGLPLKKQK